MEFLAYVLVAAIVWFVISQIVSGYKTGTARHCKTCGVDGEPKMETRGHFAIEVVLWLCFIVPGLIYSVWRLVSKHPVCASCGAAVLVPTSSRAAGVVNSPALAALKNCPDCAEQVLAAARVCKHCAFKFP